MAIGFWTSILPNSDIFWLFSDAFLGKPFILLLMTLDIQALMGYTGAVFKQFFGQPMGVMIAFGMLLFWIGLPLLWSHKRLNRKDF